MNRFLMCVVASLFGAAAYAGNGVVCSGNHVATSYQPVTTTYFSSGVSYAPTYTPVAVAPAYPVAVATFADPITYVRETCQAPVQQNTYYSVVPTVAFAQAYNYNTTVGFVSASQYNNVAVARHNVATNVVVRGTNNVVVRGHNNVAVQVRGQQANNVNVKVQNGRQGLFGRLFNR